MSDEIVGPLVSVVIPCFNAERWIVETLDSVSRQTYANIEILVVDDGSTDGGVRLVESAASEDSRIRIIRKSNGGLSSARNCGIREAAGKYVAIVDADDLWHPRKIEKQVARYELAEQQGQQLGFVYCWSNSIDEQSYIIRSGANRKVWEGEVFDELLQNNFVGNGSAQMFHRERLLETGLYDEAMRLGCEDWALSLVLTSQYPCGLVPELLVGYRQVRDSMSKNLANMLQAHQQLIDRVEQKYRSLTAAEVRGSRSSLYLWLLLLFFSKRDYRGCLSLTWCLLMNDPLFFLRKRILKLVTSVALLKSKGFGSKQAGVAVHFLNRRADGPTAVPTIADAE